MPIARSMPPGRFVVVWALSWAAIGLAVACGIVLVSDLDPGPAVQISVLFAEVVGFTALVSARLIFPLFVRLPYALSLPLQVLTLLSGTVFGSIAVAALYPLLSLRQFRLLALIVLTNAVIAVFAGIALYTYDTMRRQIEHSFRALQRKEALERELGIARDVQQQLLPTQAPEVAGLELAGICIPAIGVGGDFYDFLPISETSTGLVVADVSGKGVSAALLMAGLQASLRSLAHTPHGTANIASRLNEILYQSSSASRYATLFLSFYDAGTRTLRYCNAGHHPPIIVARGGLREVDDAGGMPIGLFEGAKYTEGALQLEAGDIVTLFTDGVVEQPNDAGDEYGHERLARLLNENCERPLDELVQTIIDDLRDWSGDTTSAHDDVTLVLARTTA